jgi:hypothetical protein
MMVGINVEEAVAQSAPDIKVSLSLTGSQSPGRLLYLMGDQIPIVLSFQNRGGEEITSKGFSTKPFHLFLIFTGPDGGAIIAKKFEEGSTGDDPPPPPVIPVEVVPGRVELLQVEPVEKVNAGWVLTVSLPNAHAYYALLKPGNYSVKAVIPTRTYLRVDNNVGGVDYSQLNQFKWNGAIESNTEYFTLLADADGDGYYYPEAFGTHPEPDCNDNDPNEHPGQTWYKDLDNDGYSDGTTNTESCTRPPGYKVASELIALSGDCDDNNPNVNRGMVEIPCNGIDDDCNPATPDFPAPVLTSPANGAMGVSTTPTLSWNASICPGSSYGLQVSTSQTDWTGSNLKVNQSGIAGTSQAVSGLANSTVYYWRVNATNAGGTSDWSSFRSFTTVLATPSAPTLVSPANNTTGVSTTPTLSWNASTGATSYGLQVSTSKTDWTGSNLKVNQSGIAGTSQAVSGLANSTVYYWRVNATSAGGTSPWSSVWSFTTTIKTHLLIVTKIGIGSGNVTASTGTLNWNGIIGTATYNHNTTVTLTAAPSTDSTFNGWYAFCLGPEGCSVTINGPTCTLKMCGPCFANATFMLKTYTITATAGTGGSISPSGSVKVNHGADKTFTITPNSGYQILDVKVDNVSQGAISTYTFKNVTGNNHTISATFTIKTYIITATAGAGGNISPSGAVKVNYGTDQTFTIKPNANYRIADVKVDGASKGAISTYTFKNVTANHTISATFKGK